MTEPGTRVGALSHATQTEVFLFGWGVYEGDFPRPGYVPDDPYMLAAEIRRSDEEMPPRVRRSIRKAMLIEQRTDAEIEAKLKEFNERIAEQQKVPMHERVELLQHNLSLNPRIKLDNDRGTVWGCACWWGPEEQVRKRIAGRKIVMVDVPEMPTVS